MQESVIEQRRLETVPLRVRPSIGERHSPMFSALSPDEVRRVLTRLQSDRLVPERTTLASPTGEALLRLCQEEEVDYVEVVYSMARETDGIGKPALEKLAGRPVSTWHRPQAPRPEQQLVRADGGRVVAPPAGSWTKESVVLSVVPKNPKKPGSAAHIRFELWRAGATVGECMSRGLTKADVDWDSDYTRRFVVLGTREQWEAMQNA